MCPCLSHQDCKVGLWRSTNHVGDEALVSGRIQDGEMFFLSFKVSSPDLHRLPLVPLLLVCVQSPRQVPATSMFIYQFSLLTTVLSSLKTAEHAALFSSVGRAQRLCPRCSGPGFESLPGALCWVSLPLLSLILFPVDSSAVLSIKPYKGQKI